MSITRVREMDSVSEVEDMNSGVVQKTDWLLRSIWMKCSVQGYGCDGS